MTATYLKACINGKYLADDHPTLPVSVEAMAADAQAVVAAGANAVHFHVRDEQGKESLSAPDVARCLAACREAVPGIPLGISTGDWIVPDMNQRSYAISRWTVLPDFVSINFHEEGAEQLAHMLHDRGVGIEIGLTFPFAAERALADGWGKRALRILIEPMEEDVAEALVTVAEIERLLDEAKTSVPRLLHGREDTAWPLLLASAEWGYQCRIGLEDTFQLPTGDMAEDNEEIIRAAVQLLAQRM